MQAATYCNLKIRRRYVVASRVLLFLPAGLLFCVMLVTFRHHVRQTGNITNNSSQSEFFCARPEVTNARQRQLTRAIVVYFSSKQISTYLDQVKWCMRSLLEVMKTEPYLWRTDLIMYTEDISVPELLELGCTTGLRHNASEPFKCILVQHISVQSRNLSQNSSDYDIKLHQQLKDYPYGESLVPLSENPSVYASYDYVVRTDLDVFFTPAFSQWVPPDCTFITGNGGYGHEYNMQKLAHVANYSGIHFNASIWNIGSTWIGHPDIIARVASRAVHWMIHLSQIEFPPTMRTSAWWGMASLWPEWHYGVLSMYGAHLAVNEVLESGKRYHFQKIDLDHPTSSNANCTDDGPIHLHTFQSDVYFSKYVFNARKYNESYSLPRVLNSTRCSDYAGYIAGISLSITSSELEYRLRTAKS